MKKLTIFLLGIFVLLIVLLLWFFSPSGHTIIPFADLSNISGGDYYIYEDCVFSNKIEYSIRISGEVVDKDNIVLCEPSNP